MLLTLLSPAAITIATATANGVSQMMASGNTPPRFTILDLNFAPNLLFRFNNGKDFVFSRRIFGPGLHTVSFTGLLSLVRSTSGRESSAAKEAKKKK